jgi:hypothetical protein
MAFAGLSLPPTRNCLRSADGLLTHVVPARLRHRLFFDRRARRRSYSPFSPTPSPNASSILDYRPGQAYCLEALMNLSPEELMTAPTKTPAVSVSVRFGNEIAYLDSTLPALRAQIPLTGPLKSSGSTIILPTGRRGPPRSTQTTVPPAKLSTQRSPVRRVAFVAVVSAHAIPSDSH